MSRRRGWGSVTAVATALALVGPAVAGPVEALPSGSAALAARTATPSDTTSRAEARRVDAVPTPKLAWSGCGGVGEGSLSVRSTASPLTGTARPGGPAVEQCVTVQLPLDYDQPRGATIGVTALRLKAKDQKHKIGTLFVNPGGPGNSAMEFAAGAAYYLGPDLVERFDVVGMDPRGTNRSGAVRCWKSSSAQAKDLSGFKSATFPVAARETRDYVRSSEAFGRACSSTGKPISGAMSTAQVARDMDVLRRAVGDTKLTYLGFSYGSYLGTVYANLFPDRVRAVAIDGVFDPVGWAGTPATADVPQAARVKSGEGAAKALHDILVRCGRAGTRYCTFAQYGNPVKGYERIMASLKKKPLAIRDENGEVYATLTYAEFTFSLLNDLYLSYGASGIDANLTDVRMLLEAPAPRGTAAAHRQRQAGADVVAKMTAQRSARATGRATPARPGETSGSDPYDDALETSQAVRCSDSLNPRRASEWRRYAADAQRAAPEFGPLWTWADAPCASSTWTVTDEDAYRGGFSHRTANPVLVVGNYWDPATNYVGAVTTARLLPYSHLLSSNSWGHTAYGTSECVTGAIGLYLTSVTLPDRGTRCVGDDQPFTRPLDASGRHQPEPSRPLPPIGPPFPGALPRS